MERNERLDQLESDVTGLRHNVADSLLKMDADVERIGTLYERMVVVVNKQAELLKKCFEALESRGMMAVDNKDKTN
jgi:hypothetical protein